MGQSVLKSKNKEMDKLAAGRRKSTPTKNGFKFDHFPQTVFLKNPPVQSPSGRTPPLIRQ